MRRYTMIPLIALFAGACATDEDEDGFLVEDDCNDLDAAINPDATEIRGNAVDEDCDGTALPHLYVGDWNLDSISAVTDGYDVFGSTTNTGTLKVSDTLSTVVDLTGTEDGYAIETDLNGTAEPGATEADFKLDLTGTLDFDGDSYSLATDWDCTATAAEIECKGTMTAEAYVLDTTAVFKK